MRTSAERSLQSQRVLLRRVVRISLSAWRAAATLWIYRVLLIAFGMLLLYSVFAVSLLSEPRLVLAKDQVSLRARQSVGKGQPGFCFCPDPSGRLSFPEALRKTRAGECQLVANGALNAGYHLQRGWLLLRLDAAVSSGDRVLYFDNPPLDSISIYVRRPDGSWTMRRSGDTFGGSIRSFPGRGHAFWLDGSLAGELLVLVETRGSFIVEPVLLAPNVFAYERSREEYLLGGFYGLVLVTVIVAFALAHFARDRSALLYAAHVVCFAIFLLDLNGILQHLAPEGRRGFQNRLLPEALAVSFVFALLFAARHLRVRSPSSRTRRGWYAVAAAGFVAIGILACLPYALRVRIATYGAIGFSVALLVWGWMALRANFRPARLFVAAWSVFLVGVLLYALHRAAMIGDSVVARHGMQFGASLQMLLMMTSPAGRVRMLRDARDNVQKKLIRLRGIAAARLEGDVRRKTTELATALGELRERDELMRRELRLAAGIQKGILPEGLLCRGRFSMLGYCRYLEAVGGDYYDFFDLQGDELGILVSDVSGHGVPAALVTTMTKISFGQWVRRGLSPDELLRRINQTLLGGLTGQAYLSAFYAIGTPDGRLLYSGAGLPDPYHYRADENRTVRLDGSGMFLGLWSESEMRTRLHQTNVGKGDRILIYSDGLCDQRNPQALPFREEGVRRLFERTRRLPLAEARDAMVVALDEFMAGAAQDDDQSFVLIDVG